MLRLRRYRVFLVFAIISILAFTHFSRVQDRSPQPPVPVGQSSGKLKPLSSTAPRPPPAKVEDDIPPHRFAPESTTKFPHLHTTTLLQTSTEGGTEKHTVPIP